MNEAETRAELIDPALKAAGWGVVEGSRILRERSCLISQGRLLGSGQRTREEIADYILVCRNLKLAVVEAKRKDLHYTEGVGQAKAYAKKMQLRFTYATNGVEIYQIDMETGEEGKVDAFPSPEELWAMTHAEENQWRDRFAGVPFEDKGGTFQARYYQDLAIQRTLDAMASGEDRILLTLATGTGKTFIAFQIAWKLFQSKWNLSREPGRRPRILFLADRNILANQAFNSFSAFDEDALVRIAPDEVRKKGGVPKNGSVFFTIFQTFMSGKGEDGTPAPYFGDYPSDFFDFIVIDECHRGGAKDESSWRGILEYFSPAVQLGLTATPLRKHNADTYRYFGEPVYTYALKDGINDGYLTPFKVNRIQTTIDDYVYTPDDDIEEGDIEVGRRYEEQDFNREIEIKEREEKRVEILLGMIDQREKTIVFCASQVHALVVRDLINQKKESSDPEYCARVTANDGARGELHLRHFQDNEKTIPTILTTSQKLSTGVDAKNIRHVVLMRPVNSMIEFKQIIGRGTRLYDGKDYFTIHDFVGASDHFTDEEWDGEPLEPDPPRPRPDSPDDPAEPPEPTETPEDPPEGRRMVRVTLADGKARQIQHMVEKRYWGPDGTPLSPQQFLQQLFGDLPDFFSDEEQLREIWSRPDTRRKLLEGLSEKGYTADQLNQMRELVCAEKSDLFDVLASVAYARSPITREERVVENKDLIFSHYDDKQQAFLDFVLSQYVNEGVGELDDKNLPTLIALKYGAVQDATQELGDTSSIRELFVGFQKHLYAKERSA
ncbi:MAG: DEAD/DEAH box helicase family protein [Roseibacillus sp.]|nr:DEAD/DEAH box helicase family protein [Roseibacillus sp.]